MKPLNEAARKKAISKFLSMYGLSVLAILLISYLLFSAPLKILRQEAEDFNTFKTQHTTLRNKLNGITTQITDIVEVEKVIDKNPSPALDSMAAQYKNGISRVITDLKNDSTNEKIPLFKKDIAHFITAYEAVLFYSHLKSKVKEAPPLIIKDDKNGNSGQLKTELVNLNVAHQNLLREYEKLKARGINGEVKPDPSLLARITQMENERNICRTQLTKTMEDLKGKDVIIKDKEDQIVELKNRKIPNCDQLTEEEKARLKYQTVDQIVKKAKTGNKEVYTGLKNVLTDILNSYPEKTLIHRKIREIEALAKIRDF